LSELYLDAKAIFLANFAAWLKTPEVFLPHSAQFFVLFRFAYSRAQEEQK
jgi:hypothetical protein